MPKKRHTPYHLWFNSRNHWAESGIEAESKGNAAHAFLMFGYAFDHEMLTIARLEEIGSADPAELTSCQLNAIRYAIKAGRNLRAMHLIEQLRERGLGVEVGSELERLRAEIAG